MKRSKLGAAEQGRRARLQTSTVETIDAADPIAAAAQAKKAREGQYWRQSIFRRIVPLVLLPKLCVWLQRLALKQQRRQQQKLLQAKPRQFFMTTKVYQRSSASIADRYGSLNSISANECWSQNLTSSSAAGIESPDAVSDKAPSASDQNETASNPLAAILGYEYAPDQLLNSNCCNLVPP